MCDLAEFHSDQEEILHLLTDLSPDAIFIQSEDRIIYVNSAGVRIISAQSREQLIGRSFLDFVPLKYRKIVAHRFRSKGEYWSNPILIALNTLQNDRPRIEVEIRTTPIKYRGKPAFLTTLRHYNEEKRRLDELVKLKKAVEASGEVIFLTDPEGVITYVNPEFIRLYGYSAEEVIGKVTPRILSSGVMTPQFYKSFWEKLLKKQVVKGEFINKCKDGRLISVEGSANPVLDEWGHIVGFLAIQRDITSRKQAEQAIKEAHDFQRSIIDGVVEPIMVIGTDYQVDLMNRAASQFASIDVTRSEPVYCFQISHQRQIPCDGIEHPCPLEEVRKSRRPVKVLHEHHQTNGERRTVEVVAAPYWDAEGAFRGIIETIWDITERKRAEEAQHQYAERLRALAAQFSEVEDSERQHLARELHDQVGQNLTALGINLNIARSLLPEDIEPMVRFHLDDSLSLVEQTTDQIRNVMADLRPPVLDDYGLVAALRWYGERYARRTDIDITVDGEEPFPRLPERLEMVLFRIAQEALTNAAKHAQANQTTIKVEVDINTLRMVITDDGIGFDPTHQTEANGERGWGLLTMKERTESVYGNFRIESSSSQGTRVIVEVPL